MPDIDISINNRLYRVTCDPGQEDRLTMLAGWADERLQMIAEEVGQIGDTRLMLLSLLMVCDELFELREQLAGRGEAPVSNGHSTQTLDPNTESAAMSAVDAATAKVNDLLDRLDTPG